MTAPGNPRTIVAMPIGTTFDLFAMELNRLFESFGRRLAGLMQSGYSEAHLRNGRKLSEAVQRILDRTLFFHMLAALTYPRPVGSAKSP